MTHASLYWLGVDEAGYGARLGPLVVSASLWEVRWPTFSNADPADPNFLDLADRLVWRDQFTPTDDHPDPQRHFAPWRVADSKQVFHAGQGLQTLQTIVASLLDAIEQPHFATADTIPDEPSLPVAAPSTESAAAPATSHTPPHAWEVAAECYRRQAIRVHPTKASVSLPYWAQAIDSAGAAAGDPNNSLHESPLEHSDTKPSHTTATHAANPWQSSVLIPRALCSRIVSEADFNQGLRQHGNKANLLSATSLQLARDVLLRCPPTAPVIIDFDRHGGRKRYLSLLSEYLDADWPQVLQETAADSRYAWSQNGRPLFARFCVDGEQRYPVAVASLASKYARELGMHCVNAYWQERAPTLRPTAGYPLDAARFRQELRQLLPQLKFPEEQFWRNA
jgi:hypothetical protein